MFEKVPVTQNSQCISGIKIVTAHEMARIEGLSYAQGALELDYMERAGEGIALKIIQFIQDNQLDQVVTFLIGRGNNGGDAYVAARVLLEKGFKILVYHLYALDRCGPLCQQMHERFQTKGGHVQVLHQNIARIQLQGVIIDGLVGTGFKGAIHDELEEVIHLANDSSLPIIAIDIPSGVCGSTGNVETVAMKAAMTIYLELPKLGFFIGKGWDYIGQLEHVSFGLDLASIHASKAVAYLVDSYSLFSLLPRINRSAHKYQVGYVLGVAGSSQMSGSALLASYAALKMGAGIVRLFYPDEIEQLIGAPLELICEKWNGKNPARIVEEMQRAKVLFIGPGIGRSKLAESIMSHVLPIVTLPLVIDADGLFWLGNQENIQLPTHTILTPHHQEMIHLFSCWKGYQPDRDFFANCVAYVEEKRVVVVLKGAPTWIFAPQTPPLIVTSGDRGMATAGSGDVLTGMIAAFIAQGLELRAAALLAVVLHGLSGECAAKKLTSYCMSASNLIEYLPEAVNAVLVQKIRD